MPICKQSLGNLRLRRMVLPVPDSETEAEELLPANIALAARCPSARDALDYGLVILAMNLPYWHVRQTDHHELYVETASLARVREELATFRHEQSHWNASPLDHGLAEHPPSFYVPYVIALVMIASFILQNAYAPAYGVSGRMDAVGLITRGEWHRPFTALFLHADIAHLASNLVIGLWYGFLVNRGFGTMIGWMLILGTGVLGNMTVAFLHYPESHLSIGASTAVFGALGLLVAEGLAHRWHWRFTQRLGAILVPLVAGGIVLGWTGGFGDPQVDSLAHVMGFVSGVTLGLIALWMPPRKKAVISR